MTMAAATATTGRGSGTAASINGHMSPPRSPHLTITSSTSPAAPEVARRNKKEKKSLDYVLRSGLAGGTAGCAAKTLIAPLDRVKILFQASNPQFLKYTGSWFGVANAIRDIKRQDGLGGLFKGHSATLIRIFPYAAIKFVAYEQVRAVLIQSKEEETPLRRLVSGSLAGVTSVFFTYPLEVVRVRMAFETRKDRPSGLVYICRQIYNEGGYRPHRHSSSSSLPPPLTLVSKSTIKPLTRPVNGLSNFYRGFFPTMLGMLPYAGVSFLTHDLMGDWLRSKSMAKYTSASSSINTEPESSTRSTNGSGKTVLKIWAELLAGGFAGMAAQTASYPLEVIRRRMQVGGAVGDRRFLGIGETVRTIWGAGGLRGFFVGLSIGYVKVIPMTATAFLVYERCKIYLGI